MLFAYADPANAKGLHVKISMPITAAENEEFKQRVVEVAKRIQARAFDVSAQPMYREDAFDLAFDLLTHTGTMH